jgi:acetylornithine/N-succinyldiaminopimelate aminotransferase
MNVFKLLFSRLEQTGPGIELEPESADAYAGLSLGECLRCSTASDQVYIVDTAADAREVAIRLTSTWGQQHRRGAFGIISPGNSRPSAINVPLNDLAALHAAVDAQTVAIILEPIRGSHESLAETRAYFQGVAQLCRELKILLVLDETLTGMGRNETLLCEACCGIRADIIVLGSVVDGNRPVAAVLARSTASNHEHWDVVAA